MAQNEADKQKNWDKRVTETQRDWVTNDQAYDDYIIDTDFHLHIPNEKFITYIEDPDILEIIENEGVPPKYANHFFPSKGSQYGRPKKAAAYYDRVHGVAITAEEIREICDALALDVAVVQPRVPFARGNHPILATALTRAYNDYLLDKVIDPKKDVYAHLQLPNWDIEATLDELERLGSEPGFVAALSWPDTSKPWGDTDYDPIFDKLTDLDLNLVLHLGAGGLFNNSIVESNRTDTEWRVLEPGYGMMLNVLNLIMTGVFDKYPDLEVAFHEMGTNWIPYMAYRMDEIYQNYPEDVWMTERFYDKEKHYLDRMPSEYVFDNMYVSSQPTVYESIPRSDHIEGLLKACQASKTFQYCSDWPHQDFDTADWLYNKSYIDDEMRNKILHGNAEKMLRLPGGA